MKIIQIAHRTVDELLEEIFAITSKKKIDTNDRRVLYALACAMKNLYEADVPKWIPLEEKMPDTNVDVLLQFKSNMGVGFCEDGDWAINTGDGIYSSIDYGEEKPIAWMPLPEVYEPNE